MSILGAAAIGGVSSIFGNLIGNQGAKKRQEQSNQQNVDFWRMQNKYNHPSSQMARLREAGLNPNLIYGTSGNQSVGNAEKIAPSKAADYKFDNPLSNITQFADVRQKNATIDNLREQNNVLKQESILKAAQTGQIGVNTAKTKFDLGLATELRETSLQAAAANLREMETNILGKGLDNKLKTRTLEDNVKDVAYRVKNAQANLRGTQLLNELRELERDLKVFGIEKTDSPIYRMVIRAINKAKAKENRKLDFIQPIKD